MKTMMSVSHAVDYLREHGQEEAAALLQARAGENAAYTEISLYNSKMTFQEFLLSRYNREWTERSISNEYLHGSAEVALLLIDRELEKYDAAEQKKKEREDKA